MRTRLISFDLPRACPPVNSNGRGRVGAVQFQPEVLTIELDSDGDIRDVRFSGVEIVPVGQHRRPRRGLWRHRRGFFS